MELVLNGTLSRLGDAFGPYNRFAATYSYQPHYGHGVDSV
jgi:hypothetical protein